MTSLDAPRSTAGSALDQHRPGRPDRADPPGRLPDPAQRADMGEVQGQGYIGQALGVADVLAVVYADQLRYRPEDPHWPERDRFLLSIGHYAIALYAALAEAGIIPVEELETYGSDDSRLPMSGMASYTPGMEISGGSLGHGLGGGHRDGARAAPPRQPGAGVQPALRRRARRGLHLGGGDGMRPPRPGQRRPRSSTSTRCRPTAPRPACCAPSRSPRSGRRSAGTRCGSTATTSPALVAAFDELREHRGSPVGADLRHPHRLRRAAARDPGEGPLHAGRGARMADRPRPARGRTDPMTTTTPADPARPATPKKRSPRRR